MSQFFNHIINFIRSLYMYAKTIASSQICTYTYKGSSPMNQLQNQKF